LNEHDRLLKLIAVLKKLNRFYYHLNILRQQLFEFGQSHRYVTVERILRTSNSIFMADRFFQLVDMSRKNLKQIIEAKMIRNCVLTHIHTTQWSSVLREEKSTFTFKKVRGSIPAKTFKVFFFFFLLNSDKLY
jgi:hypothetical protein